MVLEPIQLGVGAYPTWCWSQSNLVLEPIQLDVGANPTWCWSVSNLVLDPISNLVLESVQLKVKGLAKVATQFQSHLF
jgi:hypothetical protein